MRFMINQLKLGLPASFVTCGLLICASVSSQGADNLVESNAADVDRVESADTLQPNVLIVIPKSVVNRIGAATIDDKFDVDDVIRGSVVRGEGQFDAKQRFEFIPSEDRVALKVVVSGLANSNSVGFQDQVQVRTRGSLKFSSAAAIVFDQEGLEFKPFSTNARLTTTIESIWTPFKLNFRRNKAQNAVYGRRELDRQEAERHAIRDLNNTFDDRLNREYGYLRDEVQREWIEPLSSNEQPPVEISMQTLDDHALIQLQVGEAVDRQPPVRDAEPDQVQIQIHQSAINAFATEYAGETMTLEEAVKGLIPDGSSEPDFGDDRVLVTLADEQPIAFAFSPRDVTLTIRGQQYDHAGQRYGPMDIELRYRWEESVEQDDTNKQSGMLVAETPVVRPSMGPDGQPIRMGVRGISLRRILSNALDRDMPEQISLTELKLPESFNQLGRPVVSAMRLSDHWATLHVDFVPSDAEMADRE